MEDINRQIIDNLFEFWTYVGEQTGKLEHHQGFKAINITDTDWPNRIYDLNKDLTDIKVLYEHMDAGTLPNLITMPQNMHPGTFSDRQTSLLFSQTGMVSDLDTELLQKQSDPDVEIIPVEHIKDADLFAQIASQAFRYRVEGKYIQKMLGAPDRVKLFIGSYRSEPSCTGIVFFDSTNNAGLHMIGTLPQGRGKGLGRSMTMHLMEEACKLSKKRCVLHASKAGQSIYERIGFIPCDRIDTFIVQGEQVRFRLP